MSDWWPEPLTVEQIYGDWDYEGAVASLDRSLSPRSLDSLLDVVRGLGIGHGDTIIDVGGRDGRHALRMARRFGCRVVSVDPVIANLARGQELLDLEEQGSLVELRTGVIEDIPAEDESFQLVFARDMLFHVQDVAAALTECRRVLAPAGAIVIYELLSTPDLYPEEERVLCADAAVPRKWLTPTQFEAAAVAADLAIESCEIIGSEYVEALQERGGAPNYLLQLSRLRRSRRALVDEIGEVAFRVLYANTLWTIYLVVGKLEARTYVLRRKDG